MGIFSDFTNKFATSVVLYALRDTTATAPSDGTSVPLQVDSKGNLRIMQGPYKSCEIPAKHDSNVIAENAGFIVITDGDIVFRLRDDSADRTITGLVAPARFDGLDIKLLKTASTATILVIR